MLEDLPAVLAEEAEAYRRHRDQPPGQEISRRVDGCEEGHARATVGHRVEHTVRGSRDEHEEPQHAAPAGAGQAPRHQRGQRGGEGDRVRDAAMAEHVAPGNAEPAADHVEVGDDGARRAGKPEPRGRARPPEQRAERGAGHRMREHRRHAYKVARSIDGGRTTR